MIPTLNPILARAIAEETSHNGHVVTDIVVQKAAAVAPQNIMLIDFVQGIRNLSSKR